MRRRQNASYLVLNRSEKKLQLFVAIDRSSKFAFARLKESAAVHTAAAFLKAPIEAAPCKIHTVPTDNGAQFCDLPSRRNGPAARLRLHRFDRVGLQNAIERRMTKPNPPWTNGQVERMNRTIKEVTVKRFHDGSHSQLRQPLCQTTGGLISWREVGFGGIFRDKTKG